MGLVSNAGRVGPARTVRAALLACGACLFLSLTAAPEALAHAHNFRAATSIDPGEAVEPLRNPPEYRSTNGRLDVTLEARVVRTRIGKFEINAATYNGVYGGPVLRVRPGDVLHLHLINHLSQDTNIHFHGLEVSPLGHSDNAMIAVAPGQSWDYEIQIPATHRPGTFWYHTHAHGFAERQLMAGLSGLLIVEGLQEQHPELAGITERLFALKDFQADSNGDLYTVLKGFRRDIKSINGQLMPRIDMKAGETQLWRFSNQTANQFFRLTLAGHTFRVISRDAGPLAKEDVVSELMFGPSSRAEVLVDAGASGSYTFVAERTLTGPDGDEFPGQNMAQVIVSAPAASDGPAPTPVVYHPPPSEAGPAVTGAITGKRQFVFSEDGGADQFFINQRIFDHNRVDVRVALGSVEEWTILNESDELHLFHLHQAPFEVLEINGVAQPAQGTVDTISLPIRGKVKIRIAFTDPKIVGRFMFHCHILEHEDKGMMAQIEVFDPHAPPTAAAPMHDMPGMH